MLAMLHDFIKVCDGVVALIGARSGDCPPDEAAVAYAHMLPEGFARASYTQWEVFFAEAHGKPVTYLRARPSFMPRDPAPSGVDYPNLQAAHIRRLERLGRYMQEFSDSTEACRYVGRVQWEVDDAAAGTSRHKPRNLPHGSIGSLFKGREQLLNELRASFERSSATAIAGKVMHGLGGIGKTRAAIEYALKHEKEYSALLFVTAKSPEELRSNLAALVGPLVLNLPQQDIAEEEVRLAAVLRWLEDNPRWFLLIDNVDTEAAATAVEEMVARLSGGHVLITSRVSIWSHQVEALELDLLASGPAVEFLLEATPRRRRTATDREDAAKLSETLGRLSLALAQAAAFIDQSRSFAAYLESWETTRRKLLDTHDPRQLAYKFSVAVTWRTTFDQLSEHARDLLEMLAFFSIEPIPESLCDVVPEDLRDELDLASALVELGRYSFVSRDREHPEFTVHPLVQAVTRDRMNEDEQQTKIWCASSLVDMAIGDLDPRDVRNWPSLEPLLPHAQALVTHAELENEMRSVLLSKCAGLLQAKGLYGQAEQMLRRVLAIDIECYGGDHSVVAGAIVDLAVVLRITARTDEAELMLLRALKMAEEWEQDHPFLATILNNLGGLLREANRFADAELVLRRALAIGEKSFGQNHPIIASVLGNLGSLLAATRRADEAEPMLRRALAIDEQIFGPDDPRVAISLNNLAGFLVGLDRVDEAEPLLRRALAIDEKSYGSDHPEITPVLFNLGHLLVATRRADEAEPMVRRALAINEKSYGPEHPSIAHSLFNLSSLLYSTKRSAEAEHELSRALSVLLKISASAYFPHPWLRFVADSYESLLTSLGKQSAEVRAIIDALFREAGVEPPRRDGEEDGA
ncbi:tetratricopeptide repeat protein [Ensifer sp. NBAIM29]|nr:tetratricopeptide repeat protein [Ensifer sp. NBAIM29]